MYPAGMAVDRKSRRSRMAARTRSIIAVLAVLASVVAALGGAPAAGAEAPVGNCQEINLFRGFGNQNRWQVFPYGRACYGLYLRGGYTYTINVDATPYLPCNPQRPCRNIDDSTVELFAHHQAGVWPDQPPLGQSNYTSVAFNDDVDYPNDRSSRIVYTVPGAFGSYGYHVIKVAGYGSSEGWFEMKVFEALQMAEPCQIYWC